ncbi:MAG: hypothetical protein CO118_04770 [Flavobacteriales bacterium CG_4_9_14_3_um_filter_32_8]|nr:MAG: hypothetical protein CO118_04770 [Flavobacteriales bacterium CG_4_9_14_3_um_filter_32_8]
MRRIKFFVALVFSIVFFVGATSIAILKEKTSSLEIKGYIFQSDVKIDNALVKLYQNNKIVQLVNTKKGNKFQFILFSGMMYMVEVEKAGFITEKIQISTKVNTEFYGKYLYEFKVDLMNENKFKGVDISNLDFPTALIKYNTDEGEYMHDEAYSKYVSAELKKLKEEAKKTTNK